MPRRERDPPEERPKSLRYGQDQILLRNSCVCTNFTSRLDSPFVVFNGENNDGVPVDVSGTLVLSNPDHMNVRSIKITLLGKWRVSWLVEPNTSTLQIRERGTLVEEEVMLHPTTYNPNNSTIHKIAPGTHEWRFKFQLAPSLPESVEGLPGSYIVYELNAEIDRGGYMSKSLTTSKHIRVIRTLGRDLADVVPLPYVNEDTWRDKVWYNVCLPTRYYIYGTAITADFMLCPLHKGIRIGKTKLEVIERVSLSTEQGRFKTNETDNVVASVEHELPANSLQPLNEETSGIADESYRYRLTLPLQRSLNRARQSVETEHIKIQHHLKISVNLHNPDGHVSQLVVHNAVQIFISPNLPIGDDQVMAANAAQITQASDVNEGNQDAPPTYDQHQLDQLYDEIDTAAFFSGDNSPHRRLSTSRPSSHEDLRGAATSQDIDSTSGAIALHSRLAALEQPSNHAATPTSSSCSVGSPSFDCARHPAGNHIREVLSAGRHAYASRSPFCHLIQAVHNRRSLPAGPAGPQQISRATTSPYDMEALARIPSYNTAVRTVVEVTPDQDGLPTYATAMSNPGSPLQMALQQPPRVHMRSASSTTSSASSRNSLQSLNDLGGSWSSSVEEVAQRPAQVHRDQLLAGRS